MKLGSLSPPLASPLSIATLDYSVKDKESEQRAETVGSRHLPRVRLASSFAEL